MKKILLVEGKSDVAFVKYICNYYDIVLGENVQIIDMQGKGGLTKNLTSLEPELQKGIKIALILDADSDFKKRKSEVEKELNGLEIDFFLIPNHSEAGELETLLLSSVDSDNTILKCFEEYIACLEQKDVNTASINDKAKLYAYTTLSAGKKPEESFDSICNLWDMESCEFQPIKNFVHQFFDSKGK
jgi:predicted ATP-dependent endonuclease of OLD family